MTVLPVQHLLLVPVETTGCGTTERESDRWTQRERGRKAVVLYEKEDRSLVYVENITYRPYPG